MHVRIWVYVHAHIQALCITRITPVSFEDSAFGRKLVVYMYSSLRGVVEFNGRGRGCSDPLTHKCVAT